MGEIVQRYDRNTPGRDFVVGDIHGCYDQLRGALRAVDFAPETDRLFSVGDLIDRGPHSAESLEWLGRPWFHPCIGNHEEMALRSVDDDHILSSWVLLNGGEWWLAESAERQTEYLSAFRQLPVAMEIETARGRVGIVHADIPEQVSWQAFLAALESGDAAMREIALWGRRRATGLVSAPVAGIDHVVCGHTVMPDRRTHRHANVWFIDTGAYLFDTRDGHLTLLPMDSLFAEPDAITMGPDTQR